MRELKLRYVISLVSDIGAKAKSDQQALAQAQAAVQKELAKTNTQLGTMERLLLRVGGVATASADRQAAYLSRLALRYIDLRKSVEGATAAMEKGARVGASVAAAGYAADRVTRAPMEYSLRLAHMANTAFSDRDQAGRLAGKRALNSAITAAIRTGGGTRDDAAGGLDDLIASGTVSPADAMKLLPALTRSATASGATISGMAAIGRSAMQNGIKADQVPLLLNQAMVAGQKGGFELRSMEKWLPQALASGKGVGLVGMEGAARIIASMQASVMTSGSKDEAGNNVVNLLNKINSEDTAKDFKKEGIDLRMRLMNGVANGGNSLDTFLGLVDQVTSGVHKDPKFRKLASQLQKEGDTGGETNTTESLRALFQGTAVSKVVQDRQALMALVAELSNRGYVKDVMGAMRSNPGAMDTNFGVIAGEAEFQRQRVMNEAAISASNGFDKLTPALNTALGAVADTAVKFPILSTTLVGATGALTVFSAALGASGLISLLTGGATSGAGAAIGTRLAGLAGIAGRAGLLGLAGAAGAGAGTLLYSGLMEGNAAGNMAGRTVAKVLSFFGNAEATSALNSERSFNTMALTRPGTTMDSNSLAAAGLTMGEGKLGIDVRVTDDRVTATPRVEKPLNMMRIDTGNTNPAGYLR